MPGSIRGLENVSQIHPWAESGKVNLKIDFRGNANEYLTQTTFNVVRCAYCIMAAAVVK